MGLDEHMENIRRQNALAEEFKTPTVNADGLVEQYSIYNTFDERFVAFSSTGVEPGETFVRNIPGTDRSGSFVFMTPYKHIAKEEAARINSAYKPHAQFHTVVTIVFNPEV